MSKLQPHHIKVLSAMYEITQPHGEWCVPYASIAGQAGLDFAQTRRIVRHLKRNGYAEYVRGLFDEYDGKVCGSGHCITPAGITALGERP